MNTVSVAPPRVLVTGASGYLGTLFVDALSRRLGTGEIAALVATDVRPPQVGAAPAGVRCETHDVRNSGLDAILRAHSVSCVVHLASIVTPPAGSTREFAYDVDVVGTRRVLEACVAAGVRRIVVTSSGAAYGYHADSPAWINEDTPIRGNDEFPYSAHKRLVEEMLTEYRARHPELEQVVFRVGTVLGATVNNQITALFERPRVLVLAGYDSPFVFIADTDVVACLTRAITSRVTGTFNVAGDGALPLREIAQLLNKRTLVLPAPLVRLALAVLRPLGLSRYGPEQVDFLRYRPVLDNRRLKEVFGFRPAMTSREAFLNWRDSRRDSGQTAQ